MLVFFNGFVNICDWYALEFFAQRQRWPERVGHLGHCVFGCIWGQTLSDTVTDALLKLCLEGMLKVTQLLVMIDDASEVTMGKHYDWSSRSRLSSDMQFPKSFPTLLFTRTNECTGYLPDNDQPLPELLASCAGRAVESWPKKWWMRTFSVGRSEIKLTANASCMHVLCLSCPLRTFINFLCERNNPFPLHWHAVL